MHWLGKSKAYKALLDTITNDGMTIDDLAEEVAAEVLLTDYCGLMVDYPVASGGLTMANAVASGFRPYIGLYRAESILWIEAGVVAGNQTKLTRVVVMDHEEQIRELTLVDGVYNVTEHQLIGQTWTAVNNYVPTRNGQPLDEIPFVLVGTRRGFYPAKPAMSDICDLNIQHYIASSMVSSCNYYAASPVHVVTGSETTDFSVAPGSIWIFKEPTATATILEYKGTAAGALRQTVQDIQTDMAAVGSRILSNDKAAAEAAETLAIRRAAENATLASVGRIISRKITDALSWVAWWLVLPEDAFGYELNTDFNASPVDGPELLSLLALYQNGTISLPAFLKMLMDREVLPETFDIEADEALRQEGIDARPPVEALPGASPVPGLVVPGAGEKAPMAIEPKAD